MKIAVTSQNRREVSDHAGRCRRFWVYDIGSDRSVRGKTLLELPKEQAMHETAAGDVHPLDAMDVLISGSMGEGMRRKLSVRGVQTVMTRCADPDAAVAAWLDGTLAAPEPKPVTESGCGCTCGH
jgi:predicted Fe-Mo cluster-binding NifX family protein